MSHHKLRRPKYQRMGCECKWWKRNYVSETRRMKASEGKEVTGVVLVHCGTEFCTHAHPHIDERCKPT